MEITQPSHSNTGLFSPVLRCHLNTGPFEYQTSPVFRWLLYIDLGQQKTDAQTTILACFDLQLIRFKRLGRAQKLYIGG